MSNYVLPEMALGPTEQICNALTEITSINSENAIDTITLADGRVVVIRALQVGPYRIVAKQPDGEVFFNDCFVMEKDLANELRAIFIDKLILNLQLALQDPPEYFIQGATSIPVIRNSDDSGTFSKAIKAAMRAEPDSVL